MAPSEGLLCSIITVSLNAERHIAEALESVLVQAPGTYEMIVVDGVSTDATLEIVRGLEPEFDGRLTLRSERDSGLYDAMNKGLSMARGRYVAYLGADDCLAPGALAAVERAAAPDGWPEIVCGATRVFSATDSWVEPPHSFAHRRMPKRAPTRHQSMFVSRELSTRVGGFDTAYRIAADYELYLRLVEAGARELLLAETLSEFRLGGVSSVNALRTAREYRDVRVAHGASRLGQQAVMLKSVLASKLHAASRSLVPRPGGPS